MKILNRLLSLLLVATLLSCTTLKYIPIEDAEVYKLEKSRNKVLKPTDNNEFERMEWLRRQECNAKYYFKERVLCFQYVKKPHRSVLITENEIQIAIIKNIEKHSSFLEYKDESIEMRPIKGQIVAIHNEKQIARIKRAKGSWILEIAPQYNDNQMLISSLIYKYKEWDDTLTGAFIVL